MVARQAETEFFNMYPDTKEMAEELDEYIKEHAKDYLDELHSDDFSEVKKGIHDLYRDGRFHLKESRLKEELKIGEAKKASVSSKTRASKIQSQASGGSSSSKKSTMSTGSNPAKMSSEEIAKLLDQRDGYSDGDIW